MNFLILFCLITLFPMHLCAAAHTTQLTLIEEIETQRALRGAAGEEIDTQTQSGVRILKLADKQPLFIKPLVVDLTKVDVDTGELVIVPSDELPYRSDLATVRHLDAVRKQLGKNPPPKCWKNLMRCVACCSPCLPRWWFLKESLEMFKESLKG